MTTFAFSSSSTAYGHCQWDEEIKTGDTLLICGEGVVGLAWTWPLAVTVKDGEFHTIIPGETAALLADAKITVEQAKAAVAVAVSYGYEINDNFKEFV